MTTVDTVIYVRESKCSESTGDVSETTYLQESNTELAS